MVFQLLLLLLLCLDCFLAHGVHRSCCSQLRQAQGKGPRLASSRPGRPALGVAMSHLKIEDAEPKVARMLGLGLEAEEAEGVQGETVRSRIIANLDSAIQQHGHLGEYLVCAYFAKQAELKEDFSLSTPCLTQSAQSSMTLRSLC